MLDRTKGLCVGSFRKWREKHEEMTSSIDIHTSHIWNSLISKRGIVSISNFVERDTLGILVALHVALSVSTMRTAAPLNQPNKSLGVLSLVDNDPECLHLEFCVSAPSPSLTMSDLITNVQDLAFNPKHTRWIAPLIVAGEAILCALIIWKVPCESQYRVATYYYNPELLANSD